MDLEAASRTALASAIRTTRETAGLTQTQLAELAGLDQAKVSRYERGVNEPPLGSLLAIDEACSQPRGTTLRLAQLIDQPADAEAAIVSDPSLEPEHTQALLTFYRLATAARPSKGRAAVDPVTVQRQRRLRDKVIEDSRRRQAPASGGNR